MGAAAVVGAASPGTSAATDEDVSDDFGTGRELDESIDGPAYGGGREYVEDNAEAGFTLDDADYVATSASDFHDLFESKESGDNTTCSPQSGDVVYVPGNCKIELTMSDHRFIIPPGVTLASDRGVDGRPGGLVWTDDYDPDAWPTDPVFFIPRSDARVTGLRIRGRYWDWGPFEQEEGPSAHDGYVNGDGVKIEAANGTSPTGVEVDNCQIYGWAQSGVATSDSADDIHIHHNDIHDTLRRGLGYGVLASSSGYTEISYNTFNRNRHAIASSGASNNQYEAHHNVFGYYSIGHVIDVHQPGGHRYDVYNNTVRSIYDNDGSTMTTAYLHRETPEDAANIHENWFYNHLPPKDDPDSEDDKEDRAIAQMHNSSWDHYESWENLYYWDNHYGHDSDPPSGVGAPASERVIYH